MVPSVVLANRSPVGPSAYRREHAPLSIPCKDARFELRRTVDIGWHGEKRVVWAAWRIGIAFPFRVYDIYASTKAKETEADLMAWIAERGGVYA